MDLDSPITQIPMVGDSYAEKLEKLNIFSVKDLFYHVPTRYLDFSVVKKISEIRAEETVTIKGTIKSAISQYTKRGRDMQIVRVEDETGAIEAIWFSQRFLLSTLKPGTEIFISGTLKWFGRKLAFVSPEYEINLGKNIHTGRLVPIYHETKGVSSKWLRSRIAKVFPQIKDQFSEYYDKPTIDKYNLSEKDTAIEYVHFPKSQKEIEEGIGRLAFDELLFIQLRAILRKKEWENTNQAHELTVSQKDINKFFDSLPFKLTDSQVRSIDDVTKDLAKKVPMNRLLEGDVGSGKTVVAAAACFVAFKNGFRSILMAPTQILASQHYETVSKLLSKFGVTVGLKTSETKKLNEDNDILIGTHSLIHNSINLEKVALVIIDEQHRFGVDQRAMLVKKTENKNIAPDVLTMTATPIPRTVALAAYGDLDLSTLDELPGKRQKITTWIVPSNKRKGAYEWIEKEIQSEKIQVFVVCPLIEESESIGFSEVKSAREEFTKISKLFPKRKVGLLHGKLKQKEKQEVLDSFREGKIDILVTTPVIEVGIDVPNATVMVIEGSDRFGLAQLHQLRGRVGRGTKKSYCLLFSENENENVLTRLNALKKSASGFELAEIDLKLRGPGEMFGTKQSGFPELKIASWTNTKLIKETKSFAGEIADNPKVYNKILMELRSHVQHT